MNKDEKLRALAEAVKLEDELFCTPWCPDQNDKLEGLWLQLKEPYRHLFAERHLGDNVGAGWWKPVLEVLHQVDGLLAREPSASFKVIQLKEKFGGIRLYVDITGSDEFYRECQDVIKHLEESAAKTCEICGQPGSIRHEGWLKTLCDHHAERYTAYLRRPHK